jgi:hypothetical protein
MCPAGDTEWDLRPRRHVHIGTNRAYGGDHRNQALNLRLCLHIHQPRIKIRPGAGQQAFAVTRGERFVQFLSNKWHNRVQDLQDTVKHPAGDVARFLLQSRINPLTRQNRLGEF